MNLSEKKLSNEINKYVQNLVTARDGAPGSTDTFSFADWDMASAVPCLPNASPGGMDVEHLPVAPPRRLLS